MQYKIKLTYFINKKEGTGDIILNDISIGSFSFKRQLDGIYIHYLELNQEYKGQKRLKDIVTVLKDEFQDNLLFHAQDLDSPIKSNQKLIDYYKSLGFLNISDNYFSY